MLLKTLYPTGAQYRLPLIVFVIVFLWVSTLKCAFNNKFGESLALLANRPYLWSFTLLLSACGANRTPKTTESITVGFSDDYSPPIPNFEAPNQNDPNFKALEPILSDPYWISSLEMDDAGSVIGHMLSQYDNSITFSFPVEAPDYLPLTILGWAPANEMMIVASKEIFSKLEEVLDINIEESNSVPGYNDISIFQSIQVKNAGFSYFPNNHYQLGSDVFISKDYSEPLKLQNGLTNYDYEVLLHEIGHALGLKHPFEEDRDNLSILNTYEDQTTFTTMSYDDVSTTFDGIFRTLDWMTLTKYYGVNPNFKSEDNIYSFDDKTGQFIIDGNGLDTISKQSSTQNIFIDLRPGAHSYEGQKSTYITAAKQLTISHGSDIENVLTGSGDDIIIGNQLPNNIKSGNGNDTIFAGEGLDIIHPGNGNDIVDLSEDVNVKDTIVLEQNNEAESFVTIYGFTQGILGDIFDITDFNLTGLISLPIVDLLNVPSGYINGCLLKVFGEDLGQADSVKSHFNKSGSFEKFNLSSGEQAILVTSISQDTGEVQNIYFIEQVSGSFEVSHFAQLVGNYLDIDNWSTENFLI